MNIDLYIERIEQYETGAMSAAERDAFEAELASNTELQQVYAHYQQANEVVEQRIENSLRSQLQGWAAESEEAPRTTAKKVDGKGVFLSANWARLAAAASVALLIGWFGWQWAGNHYSDQALFAGHYEKPVGAAFRNGTNVAHPLQPGFDALEAGNLERAATFFSSIPIGDERYAEAQYYLGHTALQQQQYVAALAAFQHCAAGADLRFKEKAEWNALLTAVAAGRTSDQAFTTALDRMIQNTGHSYNTQAIALKKQLESGWRSIAR